MPKCVIIADDLTGGNASAILVAKEGCQSVAVLGDEPAPPEAGCVMYSTGSRGLGPGEAAERVRQAAARLVIPEVMLCSKRIDSTLRGNPGAETDAMLEVLGPGYTAVVVAGYPSSRRTQVGGRLLVDGVPLNETEAARDPKNPVHTSLTAEVFAGQSRSKIASVFIETVQQGPKACANLLRKLAGQGARIVVCDAVTERHIDILAEACVMSGLKVCAADPGIFTAALAGRLLQKSEKPAKKHRRVLAVVGSVNGVARRQADHFFKNMRPFTVFMDTAAFLEGEDAREREISRVAGLVLDSAPESRVCGIVVKGIYPDRRVDFTEYAKRDGCSFDELSNRVNRAVAATAKRILDKDDTFKGIYTSGGDVAVEVCAELGVRGISLVDEVLPLAVHGRLMGGCRDGMDIITKGGMVGEADAMTACVAYLLERIL